MYDPKGEQEPFAYEENKPITRHEGKKYLRVICSALNDGKAIYIDVYSVIIAFDVRCPAQQHALKKLLCAGKRSKGDVRADLEGVLAAVHRAIDLLNTEGKVEE